MSTDHLGAFSAAEEESKIQAVERAGKADTPLFDKLRDRIALHIGNRQATVTEAHLLRAYERLERDNAALREALRAMVNMSPCRMGMPRNDNERIAYDTARQALAAPGKGAKG